MGYLPTDCQEEEKRSESGKLNKSGAEKKCEGCRVEILPFRENQRREKMGHPFVSRGLGKTKPGAPGRGNHVKRIITICSFFLKVAVQRSATENQTILDETARRFGERSVCPEFLYERG